MDKKVNSKLCPPCCQNIQSHQGEEEPQIQHILLAQLDLETALVSDEVIQDGRNCKYLKIIHSIMAKRYFERNKQIQILDLETKKRSNI